MSITTLAERILLMAPENGFDCGCGNKNGDCTWCRLTREAQNAGMRRDETPPEFARRVLANHTRERVSGDK